VYKRQGLLISNAGDDAMGALLRVELPELNKMLQLNTASHLALVHHFGRRFENRNSGGILLVSSTAGLQGTPYLGNYAGSKAYLLNLGMALNYEMRGTGVKVTVLMPGPTKTPGLVDKPAIPLASLPAPQMSPESVARIGLQALTKNKPYVIAGAMNRIMAIVGGVLGRTAGRNMWGGLLKGIVPEELRATGPGMNITVTIHEASA
jgi:short-subunit dehydrogenase